MPSSRHRPTRASFILAMLCCAMVSHHHYFICSDGAAEHHPKSLKFMHGFVQAVRQHWSKASCLLFVLYMAGLCNVTCGAC